MGVINKTTEEINNLLGKVENMPSEGVVGKTPVLETGTTTTLKAGSPATSEVVANGTDSSGNPKYKLNFGIPKGADGSSSGGGTVSQNNFIIESPNINSLSPTDNSETILSKLGNLDMDLLEEAISNGTPVLMKTNGLLAKGVIHADVIKSGIYILLSFSLPNKNSTDTSGNSRLITISLKTNDNTASYKHFSYVNGYSLKSGIDQLTIESTDTDVKAVLPVSSLEEILALSNLGCKFKMPVTSGFLNGSVIDAFISVAKSADTGDYALQLTGFAYGLFGEASFGSRIIQYIASSNTYQVIG